MHFLQLIKRCVVVLLCCCAGELHREAANTRLFVGSFGFFVFFAKALVSIRVLPQFTFLQTVQTSSRHMLDGITLLFLFIAKSRTSSLESFFNLFHLNLF